MIEIDCQGSKNAALSIIYIAASLRGNFIIENWPERLTDCALTVQCFEQAGARVLVSHGTLQIDTTALSLEKIPRELCTKTRYSLLLLGISQCWGKSAIVGIPGGCQLGRTHDLHIEMLTSLGATVVPCSNGLSITPGQLNGEASFVFAKQSVGATLSFLIAANGSNHRVNGINIAIEPEIMECFDLLKSCGMKYQVSGTNVKIFGKTNKNTSAVVCSNDRIMAFTLVVSSILSGTGLKILRPPIGAMARELKFLENHGFRFEITNSSLTIPAQSINQCEEICYVTAGTYPGIASDNLPLLTVLLLKRFRAVQIQDTVYGSRFEYLNDLSRYGVEADRGGCHLVARYTPHDFSSSNHNIEVIDIRGGMAKALFVLSLGQKVFVRNSSVLFRGYESLDFIQKLFPAPKIELL